MKVGEMLNLWVGVNEVENLRVLMVALDKEEAQDIANDYCVDTGLSGSFEIREFSDVSMDFDCDYVLTKGV